MTEEQNVHEVVADILYNNDPSDASKVLSIALISLMNGHSKTAMAALDYACEQVFDNV